MTPSCPQCGAVSGPTNETCADRFAALLALDHSHQEPWGSRHGLAFAAYTLQHPASAAPATLQRAWLALYRAYVRRDDHSKVFAALRQHPPSQLADWDVPALPELSPTRQAFGITILDLKGFEAAAYPASLDAWCRAVLRAWGAPIAEQTG